MLSKTRRGFIQRLLWVVSSFFFLGLTSCNRQKPNEITSCQDLAGLTEEELNTRQQLGYVDQSPFEDRTCSNCQLFVTSDQAVDCGSCLAMKGPVMNLGYCSVWAPVMNN